jgi:hypothetical protein
MGVGWYEARRRESLSLEQKTSLSQQRSKGEAEISDLRRQADLFEKRLAALDRFETDLVQAHPAILTWLEEITGYTSVASLAEMPAGLSETVGREIWADAVGKVRVSGLSSMATTLRTASDEARTLARLASQLDSLSRRLMAEMPPQQLPHETRGVDWRASSLSNLVTFDATGDFHPVQDADAVLRQLEGSLRGSQQSDLISSLLGAERRRLRESARWVSLFRSASADFSKRRTLLEERVRDLALTMQRRYAHCAGALESVARGEATRLRQQTCEGLEAVRAHLARVEGTLAADLSQATTVDATLSQLRQIQATLQAHLNKGLGQPGIPILASFERLAREVGKVPAEDWASAWQATQAQFDAALGRLNAASTAVKPSATIELMAGDLTKDLASQEQKAGSLERALKTANAERESTSDTLRSLEEHFEPESDWWSTVHEGIAEGYRPDVRGVDIHDPAYLRALLSSSVTWDAELAGEQTYLKRVEGLVTDWIQRVESTDERDQADLRQIYIDNANVIGITCVQAGSRRFSEQYRNFDCVIIDEVSKATPPELLLPMLKGAKIVLVGDSQQLPPMIGPKALTDLAEELGVAEEEVEHLERSLFRELFEKCPKELRAWLTDQYRMHPQIMDAINQFYAGKLICAIENPDQKRAHGCEPLFAPENHIVWIPTPLARQFSEVKVGTSFRNDLELQVIEELVERLDAVWGASGDDKPRKDVGVITFYAVQARELRQRLLNRPQGRELNNLRIRVGTVDRFQGMERPIVIVSLVRNNDRGDIGFAKRLERINVAFSRAQELLVIVGSRDLFCSRASSAQASARYGKVAEVVKSNGGLVDFSTFIAH